MPARYYLQALRDWASRVARERYPHHIAISVDGRVRLEAWLDARRVDAFMLQDAMMSVWNVAPDLLKIGRMTRVGNCLTITATYHPREQSTGRRSARSVYEALHTIEIDSVPPAAWCPRHALAWCVDKLLPGPAGWVVREVTR